MKVGDLKYLLTSAGFSEVKITEICVDKPWGFVVKTVADGHNLACSAKQLFDSIVRPL